MPIEITIILESAQHGEEAILRAKKDDMTIIQHIKFDGFTTLSPVLYKMTHRLEDIDIPKPDMTGATEIIPYAGYIDWSPADTAWGFDGVDYTPNKSKRHAEAKPSPKTEAQLRAEKIESLRAQLIELEAKRLADSANALFASVKTKEEIDLEAQITQLESEKAS